MTAASRARLLADLGRYAAAEEEIRIGLAAAPGDPELLVLLAAVLRLQRRHEEALAANTLTGAAACVERAESLLALGRTPEAIGSATEAIGLRPAEPDGYRVLARARAAAGEFGTARDAARQALALGPRSVPSLLVLAEVERLAGRTRAAARATRAALAEDPESPGGRWLIAVLNAERLHVGEAMRGLRALAADHPGRIEGTALAWPVLGLLAGLRRGLGVGVPLVVAVLLAEHRWPPSAGFARAVALVVAGVMAGFAARVLLPAGRLPWRSLGLLPRRRVRAVALVAAAASVTLLLAYAATGGWAPLLLALGATLVLLATGRAERM
ncbi:tetratricopeptide repeat protein [Actinoplanes sp. NPDC051851]|uniref:tetratricopeptide repeat protein n=1 Tax=Actinoplanes sp. NPDC051851 TaxID=3154753 RepID=UPI00343F5931